MRNSAEVAQSSRFFMSYSRILALGVKTRARTGGCGYGPKALAGWAQRIRAWSQGREAKGEHAGTPAPTRLRDVYVYFDNDDKVRAPFDALVLQRLVEKR
jgi:uncharacterized protein YecE (DUF72 family)